MSDPAVCPIDYGSTTPEQWLCSSGSMPANCYCIYTQNCTISVPPGGNPPNELGWAPVELKNHSRDCYENVFSN